MRVRAIDGGMGAGLLVVRAGATVGATAALVLDCRRAECSVAYEDDFVGIEDGFGG